MLDVRIAGVLVQSEWREVLKRRGATSVGDGSWECTTLPPAAVRPVFLPKGLQGTSVVHGPGWEMRRGVRSVSKTLA